MTARKTHDFRGRPARLALRRTSFFSSSFCYLVFKDRTLRSSSSRREVSLVSRRRRTVRLPRDVSRSHELTIWGPFPSPPARRQVPLVSNRAHEWMRLVQRAFFEGSGLAAERTAPSRALVPTDTIEMSTTPHRLQPPLRSATIRRSSQRSPGASFEAPRDPNRACRSTVAAPFRAPLPPRRPLLRCRLSRPVSAIRPPFGSRFVVTGDVV